MVASQLNRLSPGQFASPTLSLRPRLAIALGDPTGIGPEVILKALADPNLMAHCEITVVGNQQVIEQTYVNLRHLGSQHLAQPDKFSVLEVPLATPVVNASKLNSSTDNAISGAASFHYLETAIAHTQAGAFDGIVTAPIAKSAWKAAGFHYPGQTELLAEKASVQRFGMLFVARSPHTGWTLRTLLATTHIPLREVSNTLSPDLLTLKFELLVESLHMDFGIASPQIAIAGLNPHSGEQGQLGREEQDWLIAWIREMGDRWPQVTLTGPIPPDTLWVAPGQAWFGSAASAQPRDAYIALYHDQGLIPVKLMAFDRAVNTTIGLPFVRTSPDHGTAFDIAGKGIADPTSMKAAIQLASELSCQRLNQTTRE
jgi:4-hydroxythreonine-4-phosphate dehydrogenase